MDQFEKIRTSYDNIADEYVAHIFRELEQKPLDRAWLTSFAQDVGRRGTICDMGCGPGHVARFLHESGAQEVLGIDLSPRMIELARELTPAIDFQVGNMTVLNVEAESWAGIVAFYALVHLPLRQIEQALREFWRVLRPGGELLLAFHTGDEVRHLESMWERPVELDFVFFQQAWIEEQLREANFALVESVEREPYPEVEVATRRAYIRARKKSV